MKTRYAPFRASDHLDSEAVIAEYLTAAAEDENPDVLLSALAEVAKARSLSRLRRSSRVLTCPNAGIGKQPLDS